MLRALPWLLLWLLAALAGAATADTVYVTDRLRVGLHEDKTLESAIVDTIPTATPLEVLERSGAFTRVRTPEGTTGWVDAAYLTPEAPASREALREARREIAGLRETIAALRQRATELEQQRIQSASGESDAAAPVTPDALREMQQLAEENQRLQEALAEQRTAGAAAPGSGSGGFGALGGWHWLFLLVLLLVAFALGVYVTDWRVRRRAGGFRV